MATVQAKDTFTRANTAGNTTISNAAGWTTASDGETWSAAGGFTYTYSIASNSGKVTGTTGIEYALLGSNTIADGSFLVRLKASTASCYMGLAFRYTDLNNWYRAYIGITDSNLYLDKNVAGTGTSVATATITTPATNTLYWIRGYIKGTTIQVKYWADGSSEPGTWNISTTDSSLSGAHQYGLIYNCAASGNSIQFDSFEVDAITGTNTIPSTAALQTTKTRTVTSTVALQTTNVRTVTTTTSLQTTNIRTVVSTAALQTTKTRTVIATASLGNTVRTVPTSVALLVTSARTVSSTTSLITTNARIVPSTAALQTTNSRNVIAAAALVSTVRAIPAAVALITTNARTVTTTTTLQTTKARTVTTSVVLQTTSTRTVTTSAVLAATSARTVTSTTALLVTKSRTVTTTAALKVTNSRTVTTTSALLTTTSRTVTATASLATLPITSGGFALFANGTGTAQFDSFRVTEWPDPSLNLSTVGRIANSLTQWTATTPTSTTLGVKTSTDGVAFSSATNGSAISGFYAQPAPQIDLFNVNTVGSYTGTFRTGGSIAAWTYDTSNSRMLVTGGTNAIYAYNAISRADIDMLITLDQSDAGGMVWRFVDASNFYYLQIGDSSASVGSTNTLTLAKIASNSRTQLATSAISFTRGLRVYCIRVTMIGGVITVYFDGNVAISYTDGSPLAAGKMGLYNNGGSTGSRYYQLRLQPLGDDLTGQFLYTEEDLSTTDPSVSPVLTDQLISVRGPGMASGAVIPSLHDPTRPFAEYYNREFDSLVQSSANAASDFFWDVDQDGVLSFTDRLASPAPWCLNSIDLLYLPTVTPTVSADNYRNRHTVTNCTGVTDTQTETKVADGSTTSWTMAYPLYSAPTITVQGVAKTVGIQGQDTGKDFYWQSASNSIGQDITATPITSGYLIVISYVGQFITNVTRDNLAEQAARALVEIGTSGIVEAWEDANRFGGMLASNAITYADGVLARYSNNDAVEVMATTEKTGLAQGMQISAFLPEFQLNNVQLLITKVITTGYQSGSEVIYRYQITATNGANLNNWASVLQ